MIFIYSQKTLNPTPILKYEKSFSSLLPLLFYSYTSTLLYHDAPWTSDDGVLLSEFSTERALEK
jgi:hypothetical protein